LDGLHKHARRKKTLIYFLGVLVGECYMSNVTQHQKNERAYASRGPDSIAEVVVNGRKVENKK